MTQPWAGGPGAALTHLPGGSGGAGHRPRGGLGGFSIPRRQRAPGGGWSRGLSRGRYRSGTAVGGWRGRWLSAPPGAVPGRGQGGSWGFGNRGLLRLARDFPGRAGALRRPGHRRAPEQAMPPPPLLPMLPLLLLLCPRLPRADPLSCEYRQHRAAPARWARGGRGSRRGHAGAARSPPGLSRPSRACGAPRGSPAPFRQSRPPPHGCRDAEPPGAVPFLSVCRVPPPRSRERRGHLRAHLGAALRLLRRGTGTPPRRAAGTPPSPPDRQPGPPIPVPAAQPGPPRRFPAENNRGTFFVLPPIPESSEESPPSPGAASAPSPHGAGGPREGSVPSLSPLPGVQPPPPAEQCGSIPHPGQWKPPASARRTIANPFPTRPPRTPGSHRPPLPLPKPLRPPPSPCREQRGPPFPPESRPPIPENNESPFPTQNNRDLPPCPMENNDPLPKKK